MSFLKKLTKAYDLNFFKQSNVMDETSLEFQFCGHNKEEAINPSWDRGALLESLTVGMSGSWLHFLAFSCSSSHPLKCQVAVIFILIKVN